MGLHQLLSNVFFSLSKWELVVEEPLPKGGAVLVGAPHTSNWDFFLMLAIAGKTGLRYKWLGKKSLFVGPARPILRALGGYPVDRANSHGLVEKMAQELKDKPGHVLAITPKGTRSLAGHWKSGFYRIAEEAELPLLLCFVDSSTNTTGFGPVFYPSGDIKADMDKIREFYSGKTGIRPELTGVPRLRDEDAS